MGIRHIVKLYGRSSVCVVGMKGTGKDMLQANVIARRKSPYYSNIDYKCKKSPYNVLDYKVMLLSNNTPFDLVDGKIKPYEYPWLEGADIYISDVGVYFPSQYCNELNKRYQSMPLFMALSRQLGNDTKVHVNCQNYGRIWDKMREMSDTYLLCETCKVWHGWVFQRVIEYDRGESCQARIKPCKVSTPLFGGARKDVQMYKDNFYNQHGTVKRHTLIYRNKSNYDTRIFREILKGEQQV